MAIFKFNIAELPLSKSTDETLNMVIGVQDSQRHLAFRFIEKKYLEKIAMCFPRMSVEFTSSACEELRRMLEVSEHPFYDFTDLQYSCTLKTKYKYDKVVNFDLSLDEVADKLYRELVIEKFE